MRGLRSAIVATIALAAVPELRAAEPSPVWKDGWTINVPGESRFIGDGMPSGFNLQSAPSTAYTPGLSKDPYGFADYSIGHTLSFARDYGLNLQATLGVRASEPLASDGFTPAFDPRRYMGVGPRVGFEGTSTLPSSWVMEWKVGASMLSNDGSINAGGSIANLNLPSLASTGSTVNVDGLLGLSYFFDSASKLTLGYRADYFKSSSPSLSLSGMPESAVNHGPMVRFSIQK
jgi:hypothetical protein